MKLEVRDATKCIGGVDVLSRVRLDVSSGSVLGLAGVNGSGKTMLMRAMLGLIRLSSGCVLIDGKEIGSDLSFPPSVGALIEAPAFLDARTGFDNLRLLMAMRGDVDIRHIERIISIVGLDPSDRRKYGKYSLGMKQRLGIAGAILGEPELIVLDEPTNALDAEGVAMARRIVHRERERGAAIVLASHDESFLRDVSDEVYHLAEGHIDGHEVFVEGVWTAC